MTDRLHLRALDPAGVPVGNYSLTVAGGVVTGLASATSGGGGGFTTTPEEHGAVGDGTTDDTSAIIAALDACATAGGGDVLFDAKTYLCNGPLRTDRNGNAIIPLPNGGGPIRLVGVTPPNNCDPRTSTGYTVIKTTKTGLTYSATYKAPSLIGGPTNGTWAETMVSVENICLWLPKNPSLAGVDLRYVRRVLVDGLSVLAINAGDADFAEPTSAHAFGLRTPEAQNFHAVLIRNGMAHGMYAGLVGSVESLTVDYWVSKWCKVGLGLWGGGHAAEIQKLGIEWCTYGISGWSPTAGASDIQGAVAGYGNAQVSISALAVEDHMGAAIWYNTVEHIHDPTNKLSGVIFFDRLDTAGAFSSTLTINGAANLDLVSLLSPSLSGGSSLTVQDENGTVATGVTQIDFHGASVAASAGTGEVVVTVSGSTAASGGELLMQDGVTGPPVPLETEARDDWLYEG